MPPHIFKKPKIYTCDYSFENSVYPFGLLLAEPLVLNISADAVSFKFITSKTLAVEFCRSICQDKTMHIWNESLSPVLFIRSFAICVSNLKTIHDFIMLVVGNKKIDDITTLHLLIRFLPESNSSIADASNVVDEVLQTNE